MHLGGTTPAIKRRQEVEKKIVLSTVDELLKQGFSLAVNDGETEHPMTKERDQLQDALMETDEDYLLVFKDDDQVGWVRFIYGNDGWDVISDYTTNLEEFLPETMKLVDVEGETA